MYKIQSLSFSIVRLESCKFRFVSFYWNVTCKISISPIFFLLLIDLNPNKLNEARFTLY
jgi:hypothetical protein